MPKTKSKPITRLWKDDRTTPNGDYLVVRLLAEAFRCFRHRHSEGGQELAFVDKMARL